MLGSALEVTRAFMTKQVRLLWQVVVGARKVSGEYLVLGW